MDKWEFLPVNGNPYPTNVIMFRAAVLVQLQSAIRSLPCLLGLSEMGHPVIESQTIVTAYFLTKNLLHFDFAKQYSLM